MAATYSAHAQSALGGAPWERPTHAEKMESARFYTSSQNRSSSRSRSRKSRGLSEIYDNGYDSRRSSSDHSDLSANAGRKGDSRPAEQPNSVDDSAWIHRDKLAQIESKEMQEAGLRVRQSSSKNLRSRSKPDSRSASRTSNKRRESLDDRTTATAHAGASDDLHVPPLPINTNGLIETSGFGFEDADETTSPADPHYSANRPNTSRIPLSKKSPVPLSSTYTERDSPLVRSRNGSLALSTSPDLGKLGKNDQPRSQSLGSPKMLEQAGIPSLNKPQSRPVSAHLANSPHLHDSSDSAAASTPKSRHGRTASLNVRKSADGRSGSLSKARVVSDGSVKDSPNSARPKSRGRPHSIHRPEGEAPWIATMYKPDPMLPPDQQILPTHAKKIMQEQWAKEGKTGDAYDRNFNQLNTNDPTGGRAAPAATRAKSPGLRLGGPSTPRASDVIPPLTSPPPSAPLPTPSAAASAATSRQGSLSGGYRITPTIDPSTIPPIQRNSAGTAELNNSYASSTPQPDLNGSAPTPVANKRQSVYRLQTVGKLPREQQIREANPPRRPPAPEKSSFGDKSEQPQAGTDEDAIVHRVDPEKFKKGKAAEGEDGGKMCGLKCVVM
ncbi:hypothetical protein K461DRAFT_289117 [Myriangium duriaei CBS 260.36]|uniref:Uncharacterized protein n=1 Tax=Myriangium duriaei CBS 260.36 TaxID=1168546 RepID=A0A9P4J7Y4_9PEZI|nr:hypothetical protein K461DRAFT_289117 [Myriangium duriaei CBS 260.36]